MAVSEILYLTGGHFFELAPGSQLLIKNSFSREVDIVIGDA